MAHRTLTAPVPWSGPSTNVPHHPTQRAGIYSSNKYISFWLLGSLSVALLLLIMLLGLCSRRITHRGRRSSRVQAHVLPGGNVAARAGRYPRPPVGDPHSREILLCAACRNAQDEMFRLAKAAPVHGSAARWSPPPPYTARPVPPSDTPPGTPSHL
ncbi:uncharacterized protein [Dermacentor albipictus]|uniref:uncharacterized protein n=1 Tax=Dermacentor albipictus TaxID=60249 RepID=UPI0031FBFE05